MDRAIAYEELVLLSQGQLRIHNRSYRRAGLHDQVFKTRMTILLGPRGVGKTTAMVQRLLSVAKSDVLSPSILYVPTDHINVKGWSLYAIGEAFVLRGGTHVCFDEIHKADDWARELKSLYDTFPELTILASGSSALELVEGGYDLSRRALVRHVHGLSFREYLELGHGCDIAPVDLAGLLADHQHHADRILQAVTSTGQRILPLFHDYLRTGYFPYCLKSSDETVYHALLEQSVHTVLESDILAVHPSFTGGAVRKMGQLLAVVARSVPFKPDLNGLKKLLDIGDQRTLKNYLRLMERAELIRSLSATGKGLRTMEKPEKIYLGNPNLVYALARGRAEKGNVRETFFLSQVSVGHRITAPGRGDFLVDDTWTFEVGGRNKGASQIREVQKAYLALDDMERGSGTRIPLWLLGFLY